MLPGPTLYFECQNCESIISKSSLLSGNTFCSELYSDGKSIAPMLPQFPRVTKCVNCNSIVWLESNNQVKNEPKPKNHIISPANFLSIKESFEALRGLDLFDNERIIHLRMHIYWSFNDRTRRKEELFIVDSDKLYYILNIQRLMNLLPFDTLDSQILKAEMYRNMSRFEECKKTLNNINSEEFDGFVKKISEACDKNISEVIQLH